MNVNTNLQVNQSATGPTSDVTTRQVGATQNRDQVSEVSSAATTTTARPSLEEVQAATKDLSDYLSSVSRALSISVDSELNRPIVTVMDSETEEIVRQIPAEELVAIAKFLKNQGVESTATKEALSGILLKEEG